MRAFRFSRRAASGLTEIAEYTFDRWGEKQAIRYIDNLESCCKKLADNPGLGRAADKIRPGLQRIECSGHVVFYRQERAGILIARILHRSMLPGHHPMQDDD